MKKSSHLSLKMVFAITAALLAQPLSGRNQEKLPERSYDMWLTQMNDEPIIRGHLLNLENELILIRDKRNAEPIQIWVTDINTISFRRKGKLGSGLGIGALSGVAVFYASVHRLTAVWGRSLAFP